MGVSWEKGGAGGGVLFVSSFLGFVETSGYDDSRTTSGDGGVSLWQVGCLGCNPRSVRWERGVGEGGEVALSGRVETTGGFVGAAGLFFLACWGNFLAYVNATFLRRDFGEARVGAALILSLMC